MGRKSSMSTEARLALVLAALKGEESLEALARRHGVTSTTLSRWRNEFVAGGRKALDGKVASKNEELERQRELDRRAKVIGELTLANEMLKKQFDSI